jgi:hypothetical protein
MQRTGAHLYFEFATDLVLYYSHDCHSPACLQGRRNPPQNGHRLEQTRRCGVAAQRWRFTVRAVSGHGPAMYSTQAPHVALDGRVALAVITRRWHSSSSSSRTSTDLPDASATHWHAPALLQTMRISNSDSIPPQPRHQQALHAPAFKCGSSAAAWTAWRPWTPQKTK